MLITLAWPLACSSGSAAWVQWNAPSRQTASACRQASNSICPNGVSSRTAALLTSTSSRP
jgi:hypothetical protein